MPKLHEILQSDKIDIIKSLSSVYGFENIRVYFNKSEDSDKDVLQLLVSSKPNDKGFSAALEAALCDSLNCQIVILVEQHLKDLYKEEVLGNAVSITDLEAIEKLYNQSLEDIQISLLEDSQRSSLKRALNLAHKVLLKKGEMQYLSFFKTMPSLAEMKEKNEVEENLQSVKNACK